MFLHIENILRTQSYLLRKKNHDNTTRRSENIEANVKKTLKLEVQLDFEDVENSEFDYFLGENFRFKVPKLSEKSSDGYVLHI